MNKIRLLLVDDHNILRQGLMNIFEKYDDISVVAESENAQTMITKYFSVKPDVVLTDIEMPDETGMEAADKIIKQCPDAKIIFLTMHCSDDYIFKAMEINAAGLVPKNIIKNELVNAIRAVAQGEKYFMGKSDEELEMIKTKFNDHKLKYSNLRSVTLTATEKRILLLIAEGKTSLEIAEILGKAKRTIDSIRASLMSKLNLKSLPQLIRYAVHFAFFNRGGNNTIT